jgi:23S rRNA-/tRNA-specific pseudouridylate synthase
MLQRVRDAIHDIDTRGVPDNEVKQKRKVNLVHRLDRGASGALLLAFADSDDEKSHESTKGSTATLIEAMSSPASVKTYVALVRGEGILRGVDFKQMGWFEETRAIKDEFGELKNATTWFNFVAGQPETFEDGVDRPRMSLVLARPMQGRWHQIRKHLNGLSHPILGDTTHGANKVNREWKEKRNLPGERICLHLARLQIPPTEAVPEGIDVSSPIYEDILEMLRVYAPDVLEQSLDVLKAEGVIIEPNEQYEAGQYTIPDESMQANRTVDDTVAILAQGENFVVASKPPTVVAHHSSWTGKRSDPKRRWKEATPMLQRVRDATGRRVNLVHRLDRYICLHLPSNSTFQSTHQLVIASIPSEELRAV